MSQRALKRDLRLADERGIMLGRAITTLSIYGFISDSAKLKMRKRVQKQYQSDYKEAYLKAEKRKRPPPKEQP